MATTPRRDASTAATAAPAPAGETTEEAARPGVATADTGLDGWPAAAPQPDGAPPSDTGFSLHTFDSIREVPAFRWYLLAALGQFSSMNMQIVARGWLVFELTGSYAALGVMSLANAIPGIGLSLVGGVIADRAPKKYVLQVGQTLSAANALAIAVLLVLGILRFEHLVIAGFVQGVVQSLMMPSRQALTADLVGVDRLMNAVALNSAAMNTVRLAGPAAAGLMIAAAGAQWVYFAIAGLYMFAVTTLSMIPARPVAPGPSGAPAVSGHGHGASATQATPAPRGAHGPRGTGMSDMKDGFRYILHNRVILMLLIVNFFVIIFSLPYMMMLPGFVQQRLDGDATTLGLLMSIAGIGSLVSALTIASLPSRNRGKIFLIAALMLGIVLVAFSASTNFLLSAVIMVGVGLAQQGRMAMSNVLLQSYVDDDYRGRVMSVYMMQFGLMSLGVFFMGLLAEVIGPHWAIGGAAAVLIVLAPGLWVFLPRLRDLD